MLHQIGVGSLGPMFRGYDPTGDRLVAIKAFRGDYTPEQVQALAAALARLVDARLEHAALTRAIAAGVEGHLAYLVQEFIVGDSMDVALREFGPAPLADVLTRVTQLAAALDLAATGHVWHGGLHPRDVLVSASETKLTGIGIAQAIEAVGGCAPVRRPYAAPERVGGQAWGHAADVFSLAAVTFELMYGRRIAGPGDEAAAGAPALDGIDHGVLVEVMSAALADDPDARPSSALAFAAGLQEAVLDPLAAPTPGRSAVRRRARRPLVPLDQDVPPPLGTQEPAEPLPPFLQPPDTTAAPGSVPGGADLDLRLAEPPPALAIDARMEDAPEPVELPDVFPEEPALAEPVDLAAASETSPVIGGSDRDAVALVEEAGGDLAEARAPGVATAADVVDAAVPQPPASRRLQPPRLGMWDEPAPPAIDRVPLMTEPPAERSRWPLGVGMLVVGLAAGFAAGYVTATRQRPASAPARAATAERPAASAPGQAAAPAVPSPLQPGVNAGPGAATTGTSPAPDASPVTPPSAAADAAEDAGAVLVRSDPPGARVMVDGRARGVTPGAIHDVPFGSHTVVVVLPGYEPGQQQVVLSRRAPSRSLDFTLRRAPGEFHGELAVESRPAGARVLVDGHDAGVTPLIVSELAAGSHVVRLDLEGYRPWSAAVQVVAGERARISGSLER